MKKSADMKVWGTSIANHTRHQDLQLQVDHDGPDSVYEEQMPNHIENKIILLAIKRTFIRQSSTQITKKK